MGVGELRYFGMLLRNRAQYVVEDADVGIT